MGSNVQGAKFSFCPEETGYERARESQRCMARDLVLQNNARGGQFIH